MTIKNYGWLQILPFCRGGVLQKIAFRETMFYSF